MGDALNALRPQRLRTKAASSLLPHWLDGYSECNSCSSRVLLAHVESANCPVAYQGLKITTSLSSVSMIFSGGVIREKDILSCHDGKVTYRYQDSKTKRYITKIVSGADFLWLVLQHVLPKGFRRARLLAFYTPIARA
nr:transposase [Bathymodiolus platifrons methanotrophic gill symbiont]